MTIIQITKTGKNIVMERR
nr:unnamed protein product [Callosobruchus chinensis]CAH7764230.1 unnamed protein product [Callosobruchus chinensis]